MGDRRKLQGEIDRCLKKVTEGVETFEDIWQKVHSAPNPNQKDKYEQELKKEIKKLQRLRDQIKAWISSTEIKDKKSLQEARKNIEQQMERFKVVERETKTKAYSKEGLGAVPKQDPQEKEKEECNQWVADALHELNLQIDKFEADIETLTLALKKKRTDKEKLERLEETKNSIERHRFHIESLEKILRAMNNDALDPKLIQNLRADIEYYVESNQDSDFKENDSMYDEIDLDNLSTLMTPVAAVPSQSHPPTFQNGLSSSTSVAPALLESHSSLSHLNEKTNNNNNNSNHHETEPTLVLTTPSSTQASSPSASPALSLPDDRKQSKNDLEENQSQRIRSNSGANQGSSSHSTLISSPKNGSAFAQQSPSVQSNSKSVLSSTPSSTASTTHFPYPITSNAISATTPSVTTTTTTTTTAAATTTTTTTTVPGIQYSMIVSQNTTTSTPITAVSHGNTSKQVPQVLSPPIKQYPRLITNGSSSLNSQASNESSVISSLNSNSSLTTTIDSNSTGNHQPPSLLSSSMTNDRTGSNNVHLPLETSNLSLSAIDSIGNSQPSALSRTITSENSRSNAPFNSSTENSFPSGQSSSGSFLPNLTSDTTGSPGPIGTTSITNGSNNNILSQMNAGLSINADSHSHRILLPSNSINQSNVATGRVPLTSSEIRILNRLNSAYSKLPALLESERQRTNVNRIYGRNPLGLGQTISYYPQAPPSGSDTAEFYYRLAPETLFFVFYYMEGTRAQYLAAKALKRQSWRFHTKHIMWFQRHEEPKTITDDYEQGTYIYFDYERWQIRKRENFMFEYKFLEDREF